MKSEILFNAQCELGEGPMWHPVEKVLYWVDILGKKVHRFDSRLNAYQKYQFDKMPGAVLPTNSHFHLIITFEDGVAKFNTHTQELEYLVKFHENQPDMRCNDAKCDPFGNLWVGTMSKTAQAEAGNLYCLTSNLDLSIKIPNTTISNGTIWNKEGTKMYYIDSIKDSIRSYDFDKDNLENSNEKTIIYHPEMRYFDGMTIDTEGMLWVAHCTKSCIRRWNPETGEELLKIDLPVPKVTSLTFGGDDYKTLFITTAQEHMSQEEIEQYPLSGSVFYIETDFQGFEANIFKLIS
jgi:sugar lactone lactonase YvrE